MNRPHNIFITNSWMLALFLTALATGCGERTANTDKAEAPEMVTTGTNTGVAGLGKGPAPVLLGSAGDYTILARSAISTTRGSTVAGNLGVSPAVAIKNGGVPILTEQLQVTTSPQVYGHIFAGDYVLQSPAKVATAFNEMQAAYVDAAGRKPDFSEMGAGIIGGMTLKPATYKWSTAVLIPTSVTLSGGPDDVWIFQVAQGVIQASAARVNLIGGARASNIFWQVAGAVEIGSAAHAEGIILSQGPITLGTGASATGRLLAQSRVNLDANAVTHPSP